MRRVLVTIALLFALLLPPPVVVRAETSHAQSPTPPATPSRGEALRAECQASAERGDLRAAVEACRQALEAFREEGDRPAERVVLLGLGWLHEQLQEYADSLPFYEAALTSSRKAGDGGQEAQAQGGACRVHYLLGNDAASSAACAAAAALFRELDLPAEEATAQYVLGLGLQRSATATGDAGLVEQAKQALSRALPLYGAAGDRAGEAGVLQGLGDLWLLVGEHEQALDYYLLALPIRREVGNPSLLAVNLSAIAAQYEALSDSQNALSYYEEALPLRREIGDRSGEASTLSGMGLAQKRLGDYPAALASYEDALRIWKDLGNRSWVALITGSVGDIHLAQFDYSSAQVSYSQALALYRELGDRASEALTLQALGGACFDLADYAGALQYYAEALSIRRELGDRLGESRVLNNMALVDDSLSRYQEALALYQEALGIKQEIGDLAGQAPVLGNIAAVYAVLYENERALTTYAKALDIARQAGDRRGEMAALTGLGTVLRQNGRAEEAIPYHQQALAIARETGDRAGEAAALGSLAVAYDELGDDEQALDLHRQALAIRQEIGDWVGEATSLTLLGEQSFEDADYSTAESYLRQALQTWKATGDRRSEATTLGDLAVLADRQGQGARAAEYAVQAIDVLESIYTTIKTEDLQSVFANGVSGYYQYAVRLLLAQGRPEEAFRLAERGRARAFLNLLGNQPLDARSSEDAGLVRREAELRAEMNAVERVLRGEPRPEDERGRLAPGDAGVELQRLREEYAELLPSLQVTNPDYASMVSVAPLALGDVQQLLREQAPEVTLLSYLVGPDQTAIFVVSAEAFHAAEVQVSEADLLLGVEALLAEMKQSALVPEAWHSRAESLYARLIAPVSQYLPEGRRDKPPRVGIVPFGQLHYLPFGLLHGSGTGTAGEASMLQDRYALFYLPSASSLRYLLEDRPPAAAGLLAMANPEAPGAPHLAHAVDEAETVASLYGATALSGSQATESRFKRESAAAGIVHLAAHSDMQPSAPLFSAILLQPDGTDDGRLETHEILNLDLPAVDLVVLSACQTHAGGLTTGDDLVGLERAFFRAGTPTLLTTLWPVDDKATAVLMTAFYTCLRDGVPKAEALRLAQQETREAFPEPYYWAGFVLVGDPGTALRAGDAAAWWLWVLAAVAALGLVALGVAFARRRRRAVPGVLGS